MNDRYRDLNPSAVVAALRSFPGRYRAALSADPLRDRAEIAALPMPDGRSVGEVLSATVEALAALGDAVHRVLVSEHADVPPIAVAPVPVRDGGASRPALDRGANLAALLDQLETSAAAVADPVANAPSAGLLRTGSAPGGRAISALDIARQAVRIGAEHLLAIGKAMSSAGIELDGDDDGFDES